MDSNDVYSIVQLGIIGGAVVLLIIGVCISAPFVVRYWYNARRAELDAALKQSMLERGMTAEQICAVMGAGEVERKPEPPRPPETPNDWKEWANDWRAWAHRWKGRRSRC
jgi:hypothetical protein